MDEEKPKATTFENPHLDGRELDVFSSEYEPPTEYKVHWRTFAAVFAVAMGNVCAALSNTVSCMDFAPDKVSKQAIDFAIQTLGKYDYSFTSCESG